MPLQPLRLELYTRPGCHLGNDLRAICERLAEDIAFDLTEVNIEADPALRVRYERRADIHESFMTIGCCLICWRFLANGFC